MVVVVCVFELHLPEARSLKQKRKVVKGLVERLHARYRVSIAETGFHDLHQRAEIGVAAVVKSESEGARLLDTLRELVDQEAGAYVTLWEPDWLHVA